MPRLIAAAARRRRLLPSSATHVLPPASVPTGKSQADGILELVLPLPPSINHHYATVQGRRVLSSAGRRFKTLVGQEVLCARAKNRKPRVPSDALLTLELHFYFVSELRRDIDGGLKITQDAVCEALGINDNRIAEVLLHKNKDAAAPRMELSLRLRSPSA